MVSIDGKPVLAHLVDHLKSHGIKDIIVNVHHMYTHIVESFGNSLIYSYENPLLGEQGTIERLQPWLGERFVVMNGDTLTDVDITEMIQISKEDKRSVIFMDRKEDVYAGTKVLYPASDKLPKPYYRGSWQDMGTHEGLEKARRFYEK